VKLRLWYRSRMWSWNSSLIDLRNFAQGYTPQLSVR